MVKKEPLDYILIPTGWKKQRKKRVAEELKKRKVKKIFIMKGKDSEEDILDVGKILKGGERVGIVTFPMHYREYLLIIKRAQKERKFPKNIKIENIATKETARQFIYGILGLLEEKMNNKEVSYGKYKREGFLKGRIRKFLEKVLKTT